MEENFITPFPDDTIFPKYETWEEEKMLARYHFRNIIYLYGAFEQNAAEYITGNNNNVNLPLILY